jgi:hypothetical protein
MTVIWIAIAITSSPNSTKGHPPLLLCQVYREQGTVSVRQGCRQCAQPDGRCSELHLLQQSCPGGCGI